MNTKQNSKSPLEPIPSDNEIEKAEVLFKKTKRQQKGIHVYMNNMRAVLKLNPYHFEANLELSHLLANLAKPQFLDALRHVDLCLNMNPDFWRSYLVKAKIFVGMGLIDKAEIVVKKGLSMHPGSGALHEQQRALHTLVEHRNQRKDHEGDAGEGNLQKYDKLLSERFKVALMHALKGSSRTIHDPRDPDNLVNIAVDHLDVDNDDTYHPPVLNLIKHYGRKMYECQEYYEKVYEKEVKNILKLGRRYIRGVQRKHVLEREEKIRVWHAKRKEAMDDREAKRMAKEAQKKRKEEKLGLNVEIDEEDEETKDQILKAALSGRNDDSEDDSSSSDEDGAEEKCPGYDLPTYVMFFDIDDTVFSTYRLYKQNQFKGFKVYDLENLRQTTPDVIKPVLKFFRWLRSNDIKVIFLSERPKFAHDQTRSALKNSGFTGFTKLILKKSEPRATLPMSCKNFKRREVKALISEWKEKERGMHVLGTLGDQDADHFDGKTSPEQKDDVDYGMSLKLPNYMYKIE